MSFLAPLAFVFAAAIPVVVVFYLLKRKRVPHVVSSTVLWQKFLAETQANQPFQKLRKNWLLLLQILFLLLAIFALSRPYFRGEAQAPSLKVIILDGSASMKSTDISPNRFAKAQEEAAKLVRSLVQGDQAVLLLASARTSVKQSATADKSALLKAIEDCAPADSGGSISEALKLAESLIQNRTGAEIHLFSDGAVGSLAEFESRNLPLRFHRAGTRAANMGIVNLNLRQNPENPATRAVFVTLANYHQETRSAGIQLFFNNRPVDLRQVEIEAGKTSSEVFIVPQIEEGIFTVKLQASDDLEVDNTANIYSPLPRPVRVALVTAGNAYLEKALRVLPQVQLTKGLTLPQGKFDLEVWDSIAPAGPLARNSILINSAPTNLFKSATVAANPVIADWKPNHPLLRSVSLDNVAIAESLKVEPPMWGESLVESSSYPLLISGELQQQKIIWISFDLLKSTWPLRVSFPIFIANAVEWLSPSVLKPETYMVKGGEPLRLKVPDPVNSFAVQLPNGTEQTVTLDQPSQDLSSGNSQSIGVYRVRAGTNTYLATVNLLDSGESNNKPADEIQLGKYSAAKASVLEVPNVETWRWFLLVALAALLFEWWFYHRRTA